MAAVCFAPRFADVKYPVPNIFTGFSQDDPSLAFLSRQFSAQSLSSDSSRPTSSGSDSSAADTPCATPHPVFRTINFSGSAAHTGRDARDAFSPLDTGPFEPCRAASISPAASSTWLCTLSSDKAAIRHPARSPRSRHSSLPSYRPQRRNALHTDSSPRVLAMLLASAAQHDGAEMSDMAIDNVDDEDGADAAVCRYACVCKRERQGQKAPKRKVVGSGSGPRRAV